MKASFKLKNWQSELKRLRALGYLSKAHIDFFQYITEADYRARNSLAQDEIHPYLEKEAAHELLGRGFPLINFDRMKVKIETLRAHLGEVCNILAKFEDSEYGPIQIFLKSEEYKSLDLKELIRQTLSYNPAYLKKTSEKTKVNEDTLKFMAITLARPFFELAASQIVPILNEYSWWENYCPGCGSDPFMARIQREDGMRIMKCSLCATEWKFDRVKCPFCNNQDQKSLKFFYYQLENPYRLYVCDQCKRYIKCVDERKVNQNRIVDLTIEDIVTLYLDTLAQEQGYLPPAIFKKADRQEQNPA